MSDRVIEPGLLVSQEELAQHLPPRTPPWVASGILSFSGLADLNRAYEKLGGSLLRKENLFAEALAQLGIEVQIDEEELARVPQTGPTIVVANHPFGGIDGLALGAKLLSRRSDLRIITNSILSRITKLAPWFLNVDVFERTAQAAMNASQVRAALRHLASGGLLAVFPAGTVSRFRPQQGCVADDEWNPGVALLAKRSNATVVPAYFKGKNSALFHAASLVHEKLSMLLLPRELLGMRDSRVAVRIGRALSPESLARFSDHQTLTAWLRLRTYALAESTPSTLPTRPARTVAEPIPATEIAQELISLPRHKQLLQQGPYRIYWAKQADIPRTVAEVGRLRELTFRQVGEGTGQSRDLDRFDSSYQHLVLYDSDQHQIVGAYRMAFCDERIAEEGLEGLYTCSLFQYRPAMRGKLTHAIELGRSFICQAYQRKPLALALLWRGIGEVLCLHPRYRRLVGPVSISERCRGIPRRMLLSFLGESRLDPELARLVQPKRRVTARLDAAERRILHHSRYSVRELSRLVGDLDAEGPGVPVLLERYLELGARVLAMSSDPAFGNCVDALIVVDLDEAPAPILKRFMGAEGYTAYSLARGRTPGKGL